MKLFLCATPFQLFLAYKIILKLEIRSEQVFFIYIGNNNEAVTNSIKEIRNSGFKVEHLEIKKNNTNKHLNFILLRARLLNMILLKKYEAVYLASIEKDIFHFILSWISFDRLYTFDDGTANIFPNSSFYTNKKTRFKTKVQNRILFFRYNMNKIKKESHLHFTVFKNYKNIIEKTQYISLFEKTNKANSQSYIKKSSCSIIIGTVYREAFKKNIDIEEILNKCINHVKKNNNDIYYIPHPRESNNLNIEKSSILQSITIAEKEIIRLLEKHETIFIYGFMSTCQFNLYSINEINNSIFFSEEMKPALKQRIKSNLLPSDFKIIELDKLKN